MIKAAIIFMKSSATFTFARALGQAEIQGPAQGPGPVQGVQRAKPTEAIGFYGILSANITA